MLYRVEGIVIRGMDYGEGNKIVTLFTKEAGKQSVMARGAKKIKSRHAAVTQMFTHGEFVYFKSGQMGTLNHAEIIHSHHALREDLHKSAYSAYIAEMAWRLTEEGEPDPPLFEQLKAVLSAIEEDKDPAVVTLIWEMRMLVLAGYEPELNACVSCGRNATLPFFSHALGGGLCAECRPKDPAAVPMPEAALKLLRLFRGIDLRRLGQIQVKPETTALLKRLIRGLLDRHVDVTWKSRKFLEQMEKYDL